MNIALKWSFNELKIKREFLKVYLKDASTFKKDIFPC